LKLNRNPTLGTLELPGDVQVLPVGRDVQVRFLDWAENPLQLPQEIHGNSEALVKHMEK
jgi:hypothetical protein